MPDLAVEEDVRDFSRRRLRGRTSGTDGEIEAELSTTNGAVRAVQRQR